MRRTISGSRIAVFILIAGALTAVAARSCAQEYLTGVEWPEPKVVTPGKSSGDPPSDAVVLFDGKDLSAWNNGDSWKIEDGFAIVQGGEIETKERFGDSQLHIEWSAPTPAEGESQERGNSGVFFGPYELQVLDSYENKTYFDGQASAIYKQTPPMVNAMRPPGEWNAYDILWTAPRFEDDGSLKSPAYITVLHNGVVTLNHFELLGDTPFNRPPAYEKHDPELPIKLQDHGNPVRYRNIWIRPMKPLVGKEAREPFIRIGETEIPLTKMGKVSGKLTLDGSPVASARLTLHSEDGEHAFEAFVHDGKFELAAVAPGKYKPTVVDDGESDQEEIPARYEEQDAWPVAFDIKAGKNELSIDLKSY